MKKRALILVALMLLFSCALIVQVQAGNETNGSKVSEPTVLGEEEVEKAQETIEKYSPLDDEGKINTSAYKPFKSKAEERIEAINQWLDDNVSWMRYIFHMKPAISWPFFLNILIMLWFSLLLIFNAPFNLFFIGKYPRLTGGLLYLVLLAAGVYEGIAVALQDWISIIFKTIFTGWILKIVGWIVMFLLGLLGFKLHSVIKNFMIEYKKKKEEHKQKVLVETNSQAMDTFMNQVGSK